MAPTERGMRQTGKLDVEFELRLAVEVPGSAAYEVEVVDVVPHAKSPLVGDRLPVVVDATDPATVVIDWDAAPDLATRAMGAAGAVQRGDIAGAAAALGFTLAEPPADGAHPNTTGG
jgi:hypothetical protein